LLIVTPDGPKKPAGRFLHLAIAIGLLLLFFAQLAFGSRHLSLTADEPAHIVRGYAALTSSDFWMVPLLGHPPLIEKWAALPLLLQPDRPDPSTIPYWQESAALYIQALLPELGTVAQLEILNRVPIMLLAMLLISLVYRWARDLGGGWAGACAAFLMALDPTMVAHSQLDTTDLGITLLVFAFVFLFQRLTKRPTAVRILVAGLAAGGAIAAKHSGIIVLPLVCILAVWALLWRDGDLRHKPLGAGLHTLELDQALTWAARALVVAVIAVLTLWGVYDFEVEIQAAFPWIIPFPSHIRSLSALFESQARLSFLRGSLREGGWWWYYPYVFLIKTPLPFLAGILFSTLDELRRGWRAWLEDLPLWILPAAYGAIVISSDMQIGYRHLLPVLPFAYVIIGRAVARAGSLRQRFGRWIIAVGALWCAVGTLAIYPYSIAYFNELIGGPANGYRHVVDSNVDWGHGFKALAQYMHDENIDDVNLSYYTWVDPAIYGVNYEALPPAPDTEDLEFPYFAPVPGIYAISATTLQGILVRNTDLYEWFREHEPVAQPGYGINVYRVPGTANAPTWVAQCSVPASPLSPEIIEEGFGTKQRIAHFDCTQAWLYPAGQESAGWFVLYKDVLAADDEWLASRLGTSRLSFQQQQPGTLPPFTIYEWQPTSVPTLATQVRLPEDPVAVDNGLETVTPVSFEGPLVLLGYEVITTGDHALELRTWWRVVEPTSRSFSLIGHAMDNEGKAVVVADGLGVPFTELQVGDEFVQRHLFVIQGTEGLPVDSVWLQTGGYWLDTMERWPVVTENGGSCDRLILAQVDLSDN
jgi:hypothetical protein